ncbi:hypothetical protein [uncultured Flavobacterium sp.]|uniref:hypothetical protein n=1 Tax=uncultured Flavobacterium sp. TaxID=165435 RepID=UPI0030C8AA38
MKLTEEQIDLIDAYLVKKGIKYLDVKLEIVDHIAIEIEEKMQNENLNFNDALLLVMKNWQYQFNDSRSLWTGIAIVYPKIVLDKMLLKTKKFGIYSFVFIVIGLFLYMIFHNDLNKVLQDFSVVIESLCVLLIAIIITLIILINIKRQPTTFSFFVNQSAAIIPIGFIVLLLDKEVVQLQFLYILLMFFQFTIALKNYFSHIKFIKKYHLT